jgi:CRP/FNR family transcriptional regulator
MAARIFQWFKSLFTSKDTHHSLRGFMLFRDLSAHDLALVSEYLHERVFRAGEAVFEEGYPLEVVYLVKSGEVEVSGGSQSGTSVKLGAYDIIGLIDLFKGKKRLNSAKAISDLTLLAVSATDFRELVSRNPALGVKLLSACCEYLAGKRGDAREA